MENSFAKFEPLPKTPSDLLRETLQQKDKIETKNTVLKALGELEELKSDYLGMSSFYYSRKANIVYEYDNYKGCLVKPTTGVESHIRELNKV